jgi:hypothetical protein
MSDLSVRTVRLGDHEQIEGLKSRYELPAYTEAEWRHLYEQSPLLRRRELDWPWGWVLESPDGALHGHLGNVPVEYAHGGRSVAAAAASDWVVEEESRGGDSLRLVLEFFRSNPAELLLNTTATANYARAYAKLGARQPPLTGYDKRLTWPLDRHSVAGAALRKTGRSPAGPLSRAAAAALAPIALVPHAVRIPAAGLNGRVERCREFDARFDAFWERLRDGGGLVCARDAAALDWRYGRGVADGTVWVHVLPDGGDISAYLIAAEVPGGSVSRAQVLDYQDPTPSQRRVAALLGSSLRTARERSAGLYQVAGLPPDEERRFARLGAVRQRVPQFNFYFKAKEPALQSALEQPGGWRPSPYDGDGHCGTPHFFGLAR